MGGAGKEAEGRRMMGPGLRRCRAARSSRATEHSFSIKHPLNAGLRTSSGMPSNRIFMSSTESTGTPAMPTSPAMSYDEAQSARARLRESSEKSAKLFALMTKATILLPPQSVAVPPRPAAARTHDARVVAVVAAVGGEVKRDGEALLARREILAVERVGLLRRGEAGVLQVHRGCVTLRSVSGGADACVCARASRSGRRPRR